MHVTFRHCIKCHECFNQLMYIFKHTLVLQSSEKVSCLISSVKYLHKSLFYCEIERPEFGHELKQMRMSSAGENVINVLHSSGKYFDSLQIYGRVHRRLHNITFFMHNRMIRLYYGTCGNDVSKFHIWMLVAGHMRWSLKQIAHSIFVYFSHMMQNS